MMRLLIALVLVCNVMVLAIDPQANAGPGATVMAPSGQTDPYTPGSTVLTTAQATPDANAKPMSPVRVEKPQTPQPCGCCGQNACTCCAAPQTVAPEIKPDPPTCGCAPTCVTLGSCACPNTCSCCPVTHITPEIKAKPANACNCCHLDKCGCCVKEVQAPELKQEHIAPELKKENKCPCVFVPSNPTACACAAH